MNNKHQALPEHELLTHKSFIRNLNLFDWAFALLIAVGAFIAQTQAGLHMDIYEMVILWVSGGIAVFLGWFFKPMRWFIPLGVCLAYLAVDLYGGDIKTCRRIPAQIPVKQPVGDYVAMRVCVLRLVCLHRRRDSGGAQKCAVQYAFGHGYRVAWVQRWRALSVCWCAGMKAICCVPMPAIFRFPTFMKYLSCSWSLRR